MTVSVHIIEETPVRLWGLSSRERLRRVLERVGITEWVADLGSLSAQSSVLLLRGDYLYDNRVINNLVEACNVVLQVPAGQTAVAAHVPARLAAEARDVLRGVAALEVLPETKVESPETLSSAYQGQLRKSDPPFVLAITPENQRALEQRLFSGAYKGVTDLITKWAWPWPAHWATQLCVRFAIRPNQVTGLSLVLTVLAGALFAYGLYGWGLLTGWLMTFLDTVDGKLARVTVTSSRFGHLLDHGLDIIHPPLWYVAWGFGLATFDPGILGLTLSAVLWLIILGYIVGRLVEGAFQLWLGEFGIFCWRPLDSYNRLITARRNPNLILLSAGAASGRPDLGLIAVAFWTLFSSLLLVVRLAMAWRVRLAFGPLQPWFQQLDPEAGHNALAVRLFTHQSAPQSLGHRE